MNDKTVEQIRAMSGEELIAYASEREVDHQKYLDEMVIMQDGRQQTLREALMEVG